MTRRQTRVTTAWESTVKTRIGLAMVTGALVAWMLPGVTTTIAAGPSTAWTRQFGTSDYDYASSVAVHADGNAYVVGDTDGTFSGQTSEGASDEGASDAFVRVYGPDGSLVWTRQFGTSDYDYASGVAVHADGNAYVVGSTEGTFSSQTSEGASDAFVRMYRPDGSLAWTRQFGTSDHEYASGVAVDADGNVYVVGWTEGTFPGQASEGASDAFVRMYGPDGSLAWTRQFGTSGRELAAGITIDANGGVLVAGTTDGTFPDQASKGRPDAFVRMYGPDGSLVWTRQFGTSGRELADGIAIDANGGVLVSGTTNGTFPGQTSKGREDAFVRMYRPDGSLAWTRQFGTRGDDWAQGIAIDANGRVLVAGYTDGTFPGQTMKSDRDAFVRMYRPDGSLAWTRQFGTRGDDSASGIATDQTGRVLVAGSTAGSFPGQTSEGATDAFVRTYRR